MVKQRESGFISFGSMSLLVGSLALVGLLAYGWLGGHELPLWPAIAVVLVNVVGALRLLRETRQGHRK